MLPKNARLSSEREIRRAIRIKQYEAKSPLLYLAALDSSPDGPRLAVVIPRKFGKAVVRNRLRRVIQASFAKIRHKIGKNLSIVVFPRRVAIGAGSQTVVNELGKCLSRIK